ncbi:hypothetical protein [Lysobacter enzymogenes]|uniref:hypothetical protein n=1 Tax=Lysobacter enzymogenes TaxID=69 RepID=UPI001AF61486|nr:hypothetical protein [Lysobacter enzymogenes]QQQ01686.1 hypothetical protein JHW41_01490 [Lysobacter enzymogenes]
MAPDGSPDQTARRRRRAFYRWLLAYPLAALALTVYYTATSARTDMGEFLLLIVIVIVVASAIPVAALIDGARCRAIGPALGGCLLGILPALLVFAGIDALDSARFKHSLQVQRDRMAALIEASARGDRAGVRAAMTPLESAYGPGHALCLIGGAGKSDDWVLPEPDGGAVRVSSERLFDAAEALMQGRTREQRQTVLGALLVRLSERQETVAVLPRWLRLWRGTDADATARALEFAQPREAQSAGDCFLENDTDLARIVADTWHDEGLRAWIAAGYDFSSEQAPLALDGVRSQAGLDALAATGLEMGALMLRADSRGDALNRLATRLPQRLDDSDAPEALADLVDGYLRAGARPDRAAFGKTPCETFVDGERYQANIRNATPAPTPAREAAAQRIRLSLCPQGRPPVATSSSTDAHQDRLNAAVEAAQREGRGEGGEDSGDTDPTP